MNNTYTKLVDHAEILVNIVHKKYIAGNNMAYFPLLTGAGNCKVAAYFSGEHNYQAVIDAIHNYCDRADVAQVKHGYQDGIDAMIRVSSKFSTLNHTIQILFYELKKENEGAARFTIDTDEIVSKIKDTIHQNYDSYKKENAEFEAWLKRTDNYALEHFSLHIF